MASRSALSAWVQEAARLAAQDEDSTEPQLHARDSFRVHQNFHVGASRKSNGTWLDRRRHGAEAVSIAAIVALVLFGIGIVSFVAIIYAFGKKGGR